jgi:hypothetical protein
MNQQYPAIRLRPLEIQHLFGFTFSLYRKNFRSMLLSMAIVSLPYSLLTFPLLLKLIELSNEFNALQVTGQFPDQSYFLDKLDDAVAALIIMFLALCYQVLITPLGNLAVARLAVMSIAGTPIDWREAFSFARYRYWPTQVAIATFILPLLGLSLVVLLPVLITQSAGSDIGTITSALSGMMLICAASLATVLFFPRFFMSVNGIIQCAEDPEGEGIAAQGIWYLKRSYGLSASYYWRLLGLLILMGIAVNFVTKGVGDSISILTMLGESVLSGSSIVDQVLDPTRPQDLRTVGIAMTFTTLFGLVILPIWQCMKVLLYYDLRARKEAHDLHLVLDSLENKVTPS